MQCTKWVQQRYSLGARVPTHKRVEHGENTSERYSRPLASCATNPRVARAAWRRNAARRVSAYLLFSLQIHGKNDLSRGPECPRTRGGGARRQERLRSPVNLLGNLPDDTGSPAHTPLAASCCFFQYMHNPYSRMTAFKSFSLCLSFYSLYRQSRSRKRKIREKQLYIHFSALEIHEDGENRLFSMQLEKLVQSLMQKFGASIYMELLLICACERVTCHSPLRYLLILPFFSSQSKYSLNLNQFLMGSSYSDVISSI